MSEEKCINCKFCGRLLRSNTAANVVEQIKKLKGDLLNARKDARGYKRDSEKYLKMLNDKKICPDCGTINDICDCPFG